MVASARAIVEIRASGRKADVLIQYREFIEKMGRCSVAIVRV